MNSGGRRERRGRPPGVDLRRVFRHLGALPSLFYYTNFSGMSKYLSYIAGPE